MTKWYVHVNQHKIRKNIHADEPEPPIAIRRGKSGDVVYCSSVSFPAGGTLVYSHDTPLLACGARLVLECDEEPVILA